VASHKRKANGNARTRGSALLRLRAGRIRDESQPRMTSATAVAAEAWRTGVLPARRKASRIPHEDETIRVGDPDDDSLANEYVGEELPGGSTPTPDQSNVDEIGRAYGLQDEDSGGALRTSREVLARRDRRRFELIAPRHPRP
jgi:hypothetical protein